MELTGKQRRYLRGLAHHLDAVVQVGDAGVSDAVVAKVDVELDNHELIKVKIGQGSAVGKKEAAAELAKRTKSHVAQVIGRTVVLYRRRKEKPEIRLPKAAKKS